VSGGGRYTKRLQIVDSGQSVLVGHITAKDKSSALRTNPLVMRAYNHYALSALSSMRNARNWAHNNAAVAWSTASTRALKRVKLFRGEARYYKPVFDTILSLLLHMLV
jgi:oligoribonuclease (3'-5' exoribonuclease)